MTGKESLEKIMGGKPIPLVAQHESWVSLDPVQGCTASCAYCYLEPKGLTRKVPEVSSETLNTIYQKLAESLYFEKFFVEEVPAGRNFPIAVGNYTDMCLTLKNRQILLFMLHKHKEYIPGVPVCIVTKAALDNAFLEKVNQIGITVIFFISLSFLAKKFEKGAPSIEARLKNFSRIASFPNLNAIHFWRPVTSISVPDQAAALKQINLLKSAGAKVSVITGLKFGDNLAEIFSSNEQHAFYAFFKDHSMQNHLKNEIFEPEVQESILSAANEHSYPVYLHTSCAVSYLLAQPDYNATFRKPYLEAKCLASTCPSAQRVCCSSFQMKLAFPSEQMLGQVAAYLDVPVNMVKYSERKDTILVDRVLTQEEQTYLTQVTSFPVRGKDLLPTLEWVGSINR
jgi:DNA repair photolyase